MTAELSIDRMLCARIYGWSFRLLQNHHDALDATQEVVVRYLTRRSAPIENTQAWLRRVTLNHCVDLLRRRSPGGAVAPQAADAATPPREAGTRELHRAIAAGLEHLSGQQRAVLVAKVYDQETFAAIAADMGLSVSSVKTHYVRALKGMRRALESFGA